MMVKGGKPLKVNVNPITGNVQAFKKSVHTDTSPDVDPLTKRTVSTTYQHVQTYEGTESPVSHQKSGKAA